MNPAKDVITTNFKIILFQIIHFIFSAPPKITLDPIFQVVRPGDNAYILCTANGDPPMRIQWAKEGQPYLPNSGATEMQICSNPCKFS